MGMAHGPQSFLRSTSGYRFSRIVLTQVLAPSLGVWLGPGRMKQERSRARKSSGGCLLVTWVVHLESATSPLWTLASVCLRQNTGPLPAQGVLWKACRLWVLAGLGLEGAAKKNADSVRAGISVFPHGWIPGSWNGAQYIVGCP